MSSYQQLIERRWQKGHFLCVGLDTDYAKIAPLFNGVTVADAIFQFNRAIIDSTVEYCCAFKPNSAFYEGYGVAGLDALIRTNQYIRETYPEIPIILDAKRADIGNTNQGYVKAAFEVCAAHAITVHPYLGKEALQPLLSNPDIGVIVLCHTSNPGAGEFQELTVNGELLYQTVARRVTETWNDNHNCSLVVGATYPEQIAAVRKIVGDIPLLIPGIGAQGGDLQQTVIHAVDSRGMGMVINASRSILYASKDQNFAEAAAQEASKMDQAIRDIIKTVC